MPYVTTNRLTLITFSLEMMKAALEGNEQLERVSNYNVPQEYPMDHYKELFPFKMERFAKYPEENEWEGLIIHTKDQTIMGDRGFKGGPDEHGEMDIGYSIVPSYQGRGYATEMVKAMVNWGLNQPNVKKITASCDEDNGPSSRVLEKAGFKQTSHEDGEIYWAIQRFEK